MHSELPQAGHVPRSNERVRYGGPLMTLTLVDDVLRVAGEVDAATAPRLAAVIEGFGPDLYKIDLSDVTFFGCAGIRALVDTTTRHNLPVTVVAASNAVSRTLELAGESAILGSA